MYKGLKTCQDSNPGSSVLEADAMDTMYAMPPSGHVYREICIAHEQAKLFILQNMFNLCNLLEIIVK
jgi:hypothetical protein